MDIKFIILRPIIFDLALLWSVRIRPDIPYALKTANDGRFQVLQEKGGIWQLLSGLNQWIFQKLVMGAMSVDAVSTQQVSSLRSLFGDNEKFITIDNGVNIERFYPKPMIETRKKLHLFDYHPIVGYAGDYAWEYGGMQLIESLPKLRLKYPQIGAIILGGREGMTLLKDRAKELNVYDRCIFTGHVDYELVVDYINSMDVCISFLKPDRQHESEQKVRQYLACGKPVVVSPGSNDFVETEGLGFISDPGDVDMIASKIGDLLAMNELQRSAIQDKARQYAEHHLAYDKTVLRRLTLWNLSE